MTGPPTPGRQTLTNGAGGVDAENEKIQEILDKLSNHAEASDPVKKLLTKYSLKKNHDKNLLSLRKCQDSTLYAAAEFFGGKPVDSAGNPLYRSRDSLCDWIIMAIEELFPQHCQACDSSYTLERGAVPKFRCGSCGGGSHDCSQIMNQPALKVPGFFWICAGCSEKFAVEKFAGPDGEEKPPLSASSQRKFSLPSPVKFTADDEDEDEEPVVGEEEPLQTLKPEDVCSFYLQRRCKHGRSGKKKIGGKVCEKKHPELCRRYCNYGTTKHVGCQRSAKECRFYHPPICRGSMLKRECLNQNCQHTHLRHTRRHAEDEWQVVTAKRKEHRTQSRSRNPSTGPDSRSRAPSGTNKRSRNVSVNEPGGKEVNYTTGDSEDFLVQRLLEGLKREISSMVANEVMRLNSPNSSSVNLQLPPGMTLTQSPSQLTAQKCY